MNEFCKNEKIILISLPANATHMMQPLDVALFAPLKKKWKKYLKKYKLELLKDVTKSFQKHDDTVLLNNVLESENFITSLKNGFRTCGLCPFDPDKVNYKKCVNGVQSETKAEKQPTSDDQMSDSRFLNEFQSRIPKSTMANFWKCRLKNELPGDVTQQGLFKFLEELWIWTPTHVPAYTSLENTTRPNLTPN